MTTKSETTGAGAAIRVLIVMDDHPLTNVVALALSHGPYAPTVVHTLAAAREVLAAGWPRVTVLDVDADAGRAVGLLDERPEGGRFSVIALTRQRDFERDVAVLDRGADDILTIPFRTTELLLRVHASVLRSCGERPAVIPVVEVGDLRIDILNRKVHVGAEHIHLTSLEQTLLYLLVANRGDVVRRDVILDALWGPDFTTETNVVERHVRSLRAKLHDRFEAGKYIETVRGEGYRFAAAESRSPQRAVRRSGGG